MWCRTSLAKTISLFDAAHFDACQRFLDQFSCQRSSSRAHHADACQVVIVDNRVFVKLDDNRRYYMGVGDFMSFDERAKFCNLEFGQHDSFITGEKWAM